MAQKEGPSTFACKSENADRQDWYIFTFFIHIKAETAYKFSFRVSLYIITLFWLNLKKSKWRPFLNQNICTGFIDMQHQKSPDNPKDEIKIQTVLIIHVSLSFFKTVMYMYE